MRLSSRKNATAIGMQAERLNRRIEIWGNEKIINELGERDVSPIKIRTIWAAIIPQMGRMGKGETDTIISNVTSKIIIRYQKGLTYDMWIMYGGKRHDIKYILDPYETHESLEIFCEEVIK